MALPTVSDNKFPKIILEERLSDGSDTSNPPADHRALFVGEDGLFHLRDSSGTVTTPSAGGAADLDALLATSGGQDIADALTGAAAPDAGNVFATMADVGGGGGGSARPYIDTVALHGTHGDDLTGALNTSLWTRRTVTSGEETANVAGSDGWMNIDFSAAAASRLYLQPAPAGDFEIVLSFAQYVSSTGSACGPVIIDSTGAGMCAFIYDSGLVAYLGVLSGYAYASFPTTIAFDSNAYRNMIRLWLGLRKVGTTYSMRYSRNGYVWSPYSAGSTSGITVDRIGFGRFLGTPATHRMSVDRFNVI